VSEAPRAASRERGRPFRDGYHVLQRQAVDALSGARERAAVSAVPRTHDYEADERLCLTSVVFPSSALGDRITRELVAKLHAIEPEHYYYPTASLHLTIKNVRSIAVSAELTGAITATAAGAFAALVPTIRAFEIGLEHLVALENSIVLVGYSDRTLYELIHGLDNALRAAGIVDDKRYVSNSVFFGSITLCRFRTAPSQRLLAAAPELCREFGAALSVDSIDLITCNAVCAPRTRRTIGSYRLHDA
jgi:hypothetical protein